MEKIEDGGPAFPFSFQEHYGDRVLAGCREGLTKREWFAGMALMGMWANAAVSKAMLENRLSASEIRESLASSAVNQADLMIKKLKEPQP